MRTINHILNILLLLVGCSICSAQTINLEGKVIASSELGSIHILNISAKKNTITNEKGEFEISASLNDTILISSIQYIPQNIIVSQSILEMRFLTVTLIDRINELDEVVVGKVLTGDLLSDVENSDAKRDINFFDVGIPGYTGKPKTQEERRLYEADAGKSIIIAPLFVGINIHKILNKISGRTKKLKRAVAIDEQDKCVKRMSSEFSELLFENYQVEQHLKIAFFYYVSEDPNFRTLCEANNSLKTYEFLLKKLYLYNDQNTSVKH